MLLPIARFPLPEPRAARTTKDARKAARARSTSLASAPTASRRAPCVRVDTRFARSIARPPDSFSRLSVGRVIHGKPTVVERLDPGIDALAASATTEPISRVARGGSWKCRRNRPTRPTTPRCLRRRRGRRVQVPDTVRGHVGRRDQEIQRATVMSASPRGRSRTRCGRSWLSSVRSTRWRSCSGRAAAGEQAGGRRGGRDGAPSRFVLFGIGRRDQRRDVSRSRPRRVRDPRTTRPPPSLPLVRENNR